jgi:hypothetical protein
VKRKMSDIILSRTVSSNILLNKHDIKEQYQHQQIDYIPIVDSKNPKHIEEITGNQLRVLKYYPAGNDICLNIIDSAKKAEKKTKKVIFTDYSQDYYKIDVTGATYSQYLEKCGNNDIRHNLSVQLRKDFTHGIVLIYGEDNKGKYIAKKAPFKINEVKQYAADNSVYIQLLLLKEVYGSLIEERCLKNGGEGFVKMPALLYPLCTQTDKRALQSFNPLYRAQVYGLSENTNKIKSIERPRKCSLRCIAPEYINENGVFNGVHNKITIEDFKNSLNSQLKELAQRNQKEWLVKRVDFGKYDGNSVIYFTSDNKDTKTSQHSLTTESIDYNNSYRTSPDTFKSRVAEAKLLGVEETLANRLCSFAQDNNYPLGDIHYKAFVGISEQEIEKKFDLLKEAAQIHSQNHYKV